MNTLSLDSFESKWKERISEFMQITVDDKPTTLFSFHNDEETSVFTEDSQDNSEEVEQNAENKDGKEEILNRISNRDVKNINRGSDRIKELSNEVFEMDKEVSKPEDVKLFSCKDYGYDIKINPQKVDQASLTEFFKDFSEISLDSFKESKEVFALPESAYVREMFSLTSADSIKNYVFYMLSFKADCIEYRVLSQFLQMCYLFKKISGSNNSSLNLLLKRLKIDYSMMYLRIGMLFPRSGTLM